jgi:hypothetical protein
MPAAKGKKRQKILEEVYSLSAYVVEVKSSLKITTNFSVIAKTLST